MFRLFSAYITDYEIYLFLNRLWTIGNAFDSNICALNCLNSDIQHRGDTQVGYLNWLSKDHNGSVYARNNKRVPGTV